MTLKVIPRLQAFSSAIRRTFAQYFTRFQLTACSRGPSATAGLLVFISEVAWKMDYLRKTACVWLFGYDAAFVKLFWPLVVHVLYLLLQVANYVLCIVDMCIGIHFHIH